MLYHLLFCSPITDLIWKGTVSLLHSYPFSRLSVCQDKRKCGRREKTSSEDWCSLEANSSYSSLVSFSFFFQPCSFVPSLTLNPSPNPSSRPYELRAWNKHSHSRLELLLERYCKLLRNLGEEFLLRD